VTQVKDAFLTVGDLALAAQELIRAEAGGLGPKALGLESISRTAGRQYFDCGVVPSIDQGIVLFHQQVTRDKPGLRRVLRRIDEQAGRVRRVRRSQLQRLNDQVLRDKRKIPKGSKLRRTKAQAKARAQILERRRKALLRRLGVRR